ncbi:MAG: type III pantothenate kinase [Planctomycetes bacterium]|nr:type III pantothenate kinase [Planctomycetota bacterium]
MIQPIPQADPDAPVIVIDIGNTTTSIGRWQHRQITTPLSVRTSDASAFDEALQAHLKAVPGDGPAATVISSVVPEALARIEREVEERLNRKALVVGADIPLPIDVAVPEPGAIGTDRVCQAAAAFEQIQTGCTVVAFGTAVTVDLIDDEGTLLGGAILPGVDLQLRALHEHTAILPEVARVVPELPYGRNTVEAIQNGVCRGIAGAARGLIESYATHLNRWPQVIATGGDVQFLQPYCDFIDTFVTDLALRGVGFAYSKYLADVGA